MKKFLVLLAATLSFNAFAGSCAQSVNNISGLDKATKQQMIIQCEQAKLDTITQIPGEVSDATVEKMDKWSEISLKFAKAIGVAAREVGVATNEFLQTPAGKFTAAIILWKVLSISQWTMFFLITGVTTIVVRSFIRLMRLSHYEERETKFFGRRKQPIYSTWRDLGDTQAFFVVCGYAVIIIVFLVAGINIL
ncbi:hypothetical protein FDJ19_gp143 [Vibrio phage Ceto]|uniref:Uncharacterized protein n=1 Tax=Vibrio phage Ceto TaxID=2570300 RepID=A0A2H5BGP1_9CAUD|nr:hypothetical protein FDJ19_gp143 [Vibrio phage Ceto]AUG85155.1 hypothetical protein CETO_173 [Vibrio phage Ceto]